MANYIDKSILVEAYVKLDKNIRDYSPDEIIGVQTSLQEFAEYRSKFFLNSDVDAEVYLEEGSVVVWLTVIGTVYSLVSQYPDFREGIKLLYSDARRLSENLISETMFELKGKSKSIRRLEARVGVIGNLNNIVNKISTLEYMSGDVSVWASVRVFEKVEKEINHLFEAKIKEPTEVEYIKNQLRNLVNRIPESPRHPSRGSHPEAGVAAYQVCRSNLVNTLA